MTPQRIQLRRTAGWRKPAGAIVVARPSRWGNPYRVRGLSVLGPARPVDGGELVGYASHSSVELARAYAVELYRRDIDCGIRSSLTADLIRRELRGRDVACWCRTDRPCHGDVLLGLANG